MPSAKPSRGKSHDPAAPASCASWGWCAPAARSSSPERLRRGPAGARPRRARMTASKPAQGAPRPARPLRTTSGPARERLRCLSYASHGHPIPGREGGGRAKETNPEGGEPPWHTWSTATAASRGKGTTAGRTTASSACTTITAGTPARIGGTGNTRPVLSGPGAFRPGPRNGVRRASARAPSRLPRTGNRDPFRGFSSRGPSAGQDGSRCHARW